MESNTFWVNPDFNEIFVFVNIEVSTGRAEFKEASVIDGVQHYVFKEKPSTQKFKDKIHRILLESRLPHWPYKDRLMLTVGVSGHKKVYGVKDLDNIAKPVLDAFKGIVFVDDKQIELLIVTKQIWDFPQQGFTIGLRVMDPAPAIDVYSPGLYSSGTDIWADVRAEKAKSRENHVLLFNIEP